MQDLSAHVQLVKFKNVDSLQLNSISEKCGSVVMISATDWLQRRPLHIGGGLQQLIWASKLSGRYLER